MYANIPNVQYLVSTINQQIEYSSMVNNFTYLWLWHHRTPTVIKLIKNYTILLWTFFFFFFFRNNEEKRSPSKKGCWQSLFIFMKICINVCTCVRDTACTVSKILTILRQKKLLIFGGFIFFLFFFLYKFPEMCFNNVYLG